MQHVLLHVASLGSGPASQLLLLLPKEEAGRGLGPGEAAGFKVSCRVVAFFPSRLAGKGVGRMINDYSLCVYTRTASQSKNRVRLPVSQRRWGGLAMAFESGLVI